MDRRRSSDTRNSKFRRKSSAAKPSIRDQWKDEDDLDEEMEEIFNPTSDHFSIAELTGEGKVEPPHYDENDYELHRRGSFQYHQPLHRLYHHKHRKSHKTERDENRPMRSVVEESSPLVVEGDDSAKEESQNHQSLSPSKVLNNQDDRVQFYVGSSTSLETSTAPSINGSADKMALKSALRGPLKQVGGSAVGLRCGVSYEFLTWRLSVKKTILPSSPSQALPISEKIPEEHELQPCFTDTALAQPIEEGLSLGIASLDSSKSSQAKVKFMLGEDSREELQKTFADAPKDSRHFMEEQNGFPKYNNRHPRKVSKKRKHHGLDVNKPYGTILEPEEAETLPTADLDDMASHRFEDPKGIRRHKFHRNSLASILNLKKDDSGSLKLSFGKKKFNHEPHELFVELHELLEYENYGDLEWRETARWIKYEEDVELSIDRWGKPHVPPLYFHSLLTLRNALDHGAVLIDLEDKETTNIAKKITDSFIFTDQITHEDREAVVQALMKRHRHVNEKSLPSLRRNSSGYGNLNLLSHDKNRSPLFLKSVKSKPENDSNHAANNEEGTPNETAVLMPNENNVNNREFTPNTKRKSFVGDRAAEPSILRRIPENAEGAVVLVGELDGLRKPASVFVRLSEGRSLQSWLEIPINIRFIFVYLGPIDFVDYHEVGRCIGSLMSNQDFHEAAYKAENLKKELLRAMNHFLDMSTVVPPGRWKKMSIMPSVCDEIRRKSVVPPNQISHFNISEELEPGYDPLERTGKFLGGLIEDIKHRFPWYKSDILDGLNFQCVASVIFIYFAAVSGAIAFGGLLAEKTNLAIGVSETLIGTAICGIIFSLLSGQPLIIIGTTGPLLMFDEMLFQLRENFSSDFLVIRVWVGIWTAVIAIIVVAAEGSTLVNFFSRFVQEIFATIISLLFIMESLTKLYTIFQENPLQSYYCNESSYNATNSSDYVVPLNQPQPNTALLSAILMIGTFYIAFFLRHFRNSKFLGRSARRALGDFGVPIAIVIMVLMDYLIPDTFTQKLSVPDGLSPSTPRSWIVSPVPVTIWEVAIAFVGGLLIFILLFMETQICELIISKKRLKKGSGFHLDMVLIGFMEMISAFLGGPWQCAATVRSISHVSSLIVWSKTHAPGEAPYIVDVKEQRLTNFLVSLLVGISVLMGPVLRQVPLAALFGVFLYMGISALSGIHLYERFLLIFMPRKHHPDFPFVRKVRTSKMHLYTVIQIACIAVLWIIKVYIAPAFPFGLLSMIFIHYQMKRLFTEDEYRAVKDDEEDSETEDEPDFYEQIVA
ncbi:band 3 anion transport protein-like [Uloborus diversus]|uniref:band 3 anion transport protein-like n=1 Tax=Uloborus diversus TaxID=327109 RepID=UPI0024091454|nr:band 3 anion transport protein-like [Uloborus diversus]